MNRILSILLLFACLTNCYSQQVEDSLVTEISLMNSTSIPDSTNFFKHYPNPFAPSHTIKIQVKEKSNIMIDAYNIDVQSKDTTFLFTLINKEFEPGRYSIGYNVKKFPSGIYLFKLSSGDILDFQKFIIMK